jgi:hypothetical protein
MARRCRNTVASRAQTNATAEGDSFTTRWHVAFVIFVMFEHAEGDEDDEHDKDDKDGGE